MIDKLFFFAAVAIVTMSLYFASKYDQSKNACLNRCNTTYIVRNNDQVYKTCVEACKEKNQ